MDLRNLWYWLKCIGESENMLHTLGYLDALVEEAENRRDEALELVKKKPELLALAKEEGLVTASGRLAERY